MSGSKERQIAVPDIDHTVVMRAAFAASATVSPRVESPAEHQERPGPVWQENNHSDWEIRWLETSEDMRSEVSDVATTHFGFSRVVSVQKIDRVENKSHNFKVSGVDASGNEMTVFIKKSIREKREAALNVIGKMYDYLATKNVPTQRNVEAESGARCVWHNGCLWQAFEYVDGHHFRGTEEELAQAGGTVADIHHAFADAPEELLNEVEHAHPSRIRKWSPEDLETTLLNAEAAVRRGDATPRQRMLAQNAVYIREHAKRGESDLPSMVGARRQLGKGTVHPQDFIFKDGELRAFIDVEEMEQTELVRDVATALHRQVRQYMVFNKLSSPADLLKGVGIFLDAYIAKNPLTKAEVLLIPVFLRDSLLTKVMSASQSAGYVGEAESEGASEIQKFAVLLEEVELIEAAVQAYAVKLA